ncbi:DUF4430 domain-containing protein [Aerococcaceae bacterium DSM 111176]|nr:DUF4430 domain-containing protein [Aerococcaceae bacterium DSM 111176]
MKKIVLLISVLFIFAGCQNETENNNDVQIESTETQANQEESITVMITVDGERISELEHDLPYQEGQTLLETMQGVYEIQEEDGFIQAINRYTQDPDQNLWWTFTVNEEFAEVGAAELVPEPGDVIEFTLSEF